VFGLGVIAAGCGGVAGEELFGGNGAGGSGAHNGTGGTGGMIPLTCGDGVIDPGEQCDGADLGGKTCADQGFDQPAGLACKHDCTLDLSGCEPTCDGKTLEPGEKCDGMLLGGQTCVDFGYAQAGTLACKSCLPDLTGCTAACGNGIAEPGEKCDGADLGGKTCKDFGFSKGAGLACQPGCADWSKAGCKPTCDDGVLEPGEQCDGNNLDGHTCQEFGFANPAGLKCGATCAGLDPGGCKAVCGNGMMEPGEQCDDGDTTPGDGCSSKCQKEGLSCGSATPISVGPGTMMVSGSTVGGGQHTGANCAGSDGPDRIFAVTATANGFLTASLPRGSTSYDSLLYVSDGCTDSNDNDDFLCADSYDPQNMSVLNGGEVLSFRVTAGQTFYLFVDGVFSGDKGGFQLVLNLASGTDCNDPVPIPLVPGTPMTVLGSNTGIMPGTQGSCGGGPGGQVVYRITHANNGPITVDTDQNATDYNAVLYARTSCASGNSEVACENQPGTAQESMGIPNVQTNVPVFVWVDGSQTGGGSAFGNYGLVLTP
jgi:cysteine-rich repeat protein